MDVIQDTYNSPNHHDDFPIPDAFTTAQQKSFESIVKAPYQSPYNAYNLARSVESPYTSLGSGRSSYASIKPAKYSSLRAKAVRASSQHESKSKAVMQALQNLQDKIGSLEIDRVKAENNLKSLASETTEYKELLQQKHALSPSVKSPNSSKHDSHSEVLESQLENAQGRCEVLEKQLEYMRKMMQGQHPVSPQSITSPSPIATTVSSPRYSVTTTQHLKATPCHYQPVATHHDKVNPRESSRLTTVEESPALEKLNDLEKEHLKLSASQNQTENKIRELEEKIREESHCRKLLEDKATELQQVVALTTQTNGPITSPTTSYESEKPKRTKKKKTKKKILDFDTKRNVPTVRQPLSPTHYHLDLANIPFVVGQPKECFISLALFETQNHIMSQSTSRSHAVGANVQNIISIMKSHSKLCGYDELQKTTTTTKSVSPRIKTRSPRSKDDLHELFSTLNDEFAQLGNEHRILVTKLQQNYPQDVLNNLERDLERIVDKMETKGKQINTIRELLTSVKPVVGKKPRKHPNNRIKVGSQEIEVVTTIRPSKVHSTETKTNSNLELLKNVKKLQYTLQKDDLKWE